MLSSISRMFLNVSQPSASASSGNRLFLFFSSLKYTLLKYSVISSYQIRFSSLKRFTSSSLTICLESSSFNLSNSFHDSLKLISSIGHFTSLYNLADIIDNQNKSSYLLNSRFVNLLPCLLSSAQLQLFLLLSAGLLLDVRTILRASQ